MVSGRLVNVKGGSRSNLFNPIFCTSSKGSGFELPRRGCAPLLVVTNPPKMEIPSPIVKVHIISYYTQWFPASRNNYPWNLSSSKRDFENWNTDHWLESILGSTVILVPRFLLRRRHPIFFHAPPPHTTNLSCIKSNTCLNVGICCFRSSHIPYATCLFAYPLYPQAIQPFVQLAWELHILFSCKANGG